jgi:diguanylate cyclase (GGDEF)-like protein/PAS domain S-box-containing protein
MSSPGGYSKISGGFALTLAIAAIGIFVWIFAQVTAFTFTKQDATAASQIVSRYFNQDRGEIEAIAKGASPSPAFLATIDRGLNAAVFFGFKIYDSSGHLRYSASAATGSSPGTANAGTFNETAALAARSKTAITETGEVQTPAGKRYLAENITPLLRDGKVVAVQEIYLEQTARLLQLRDRISTLTLLAMLLAAIAFGVPAMAWRRKSLDLANRERELEVQTRRFKTALDNLPLGVTLFDSDRKLAIANERYARMFATPLKLLKPGTAVDVIRKQRCEHGSPLMSDFEYDEDGEQRYRRLANGIERANETWQLSDGRTIKTRRHDVPGGGWVSLHEDVTQELRQQEELATARRFLDKVIENIPAAIIVKDAKTLSYQVANKAVADVHGVPPQDIIGKTTSDVFEPAQASRIDETDRMVLARNSREAHCTEGVIVTPGRGERLIATKRLAVRNPNGEAAWLITIIEDVTERRAAEAQISFLAHHDPLTELSNRASFYDSVDRAIAERRRCPGLAIALFDLDGFKEINDVFGHAAGDEVLRTVSHRLQSKVAGIDVVARLGGDEFAVMFRSRTEEETLDPLLNEMIAEIRKPIKFEMHRLVVEASAGLALLPPGPIERSDLLRQADLALYEAKSQGKGVYCTFIPEIMERRMSRKALEIDLHSAIEKDQFEVHYQPIVDLATGEIVSMEALVRWRHPQRGLVSPLDFIPIAEESGLIVQIGEIVLEKACRAAADWPKHVRVSVNLSPVQFGDRSLAAKIARVLMETNIRPQRLELEITEAALLDDSFDNIQLLSDLRATGIRIVMDDFGTGYSSLNYLRNFPFDKIKIDRSYVRDLEAGANHAHTILSAVLAMAQGLDLSTTAEGVETEAQRDILRDAGCTEMQGYFFSRPVPQAEVAKLFERNAQSLTEQAKSHAA